MGYRRIDMKSWPRAELFRHYMHWNRCAYSMTVDIDITKCVEVAGALGIKLHAVQLYMLCRVVNSMDEFRTFILPGGFLAVWDECRPLFTVFNGETKLFYCLHTPYNSDFGAFYRGYMDVTEKYRGSPSFMPMGGEPADCVNISSMPWVDFSAFSLHLNSDGVYTQPIFTMGKFRHENGRTIMPLAMQVHHSVCDGYHCGLFIDSLRRLVADAESWLTASPLITAD